MKNFSERASNKHESKNAPGYLCLFLFFLMNGKAHRHLFLYLWVWYSVSYLLKTRLEKSHMIAHDLIWDHMILKWEFHSHMFSYDYLSLTHMQSYEEKFLTKNHTIMWEKNFFLMWDHIKSRVIIWDHIRSH